MSDIVKREEHRIVREMPEDQARSLQDMFRWVIMPIHDWTDVHYNLGMNQLVYGNGDPAIPTTFEEVPKKLESKP